MKIGAKNGAIQYKPKNATKISTQRSNSHKLTWTMPFAALWDCGEVVIFTVIELFISICRLTLQPMFSEDCLLLRVISIDHSSECFCSFLSMPQNQSEDGYTNHFLFCSRSPWLL